MAQKITPCLWFNDKAEEAAKFYVETFKDGKIGETTYYDKASAEVSGQPAGSVLTVEFEIHGQKFLALNGGPVFKLSEAVSFIIDCKDQDEVDYFWTKLTANGGEESVCGWLKDKFGLSWQVVPEILPKLLSDPDKAKAGRVMEAMLKMKKIEIVGLKKAYEAN